MEKAWELPPDAVEITDIRGWMLTICFENGETRVFDAKAQLLPRKCYAPLRNEALFQTAKIQNGTVAWNGELDVDPEWLYEESLPVRE